MARKSKNKHADEVEDDVARMKENMATLLTSVEHWQRMAVASDREASFSKQELREAVRELSKLRAEVRELKDDTTKLKNNASYTMSLYDRRETAKFSDEEILKDLKKTIDDLSKVPESVRIAYAKISTAGEFLTWAKANPTCIDQSKLPQGTGITAFVELATFFRDEKVPASIDAHGGRPSDTARGIAGMLDAAQEQNSGVGHEAVSYLTQKVSAITVAADQQKKSDVWTYVQSCRRARVNQAKYYMLHVRNLHRNVSEAQVHEAFRTAGNLTMAHLHKTNEGRSRRYATIAYYDKESADTAKTYHDVLQLNGQAVEVYDWIDPVTKNENVPLQDTSNNTISSSSNNRVVQPLQQR